MQKKVGNYLRKSSWGQQKGYVEPPKEGDLVVEWRGAGEPEKEKGYIQEMADAWWKRTEGGL